MKKLTTVYGGQWGSEGKGQIVAYMAEKSNKQFAAVTKESGKRPYVTPITAVRVGGPNAGHTATAADGKEIKAQSLPIPGFINKEARLVIGPSGMLYMPIMRDEMDRMRNIWGGSPPVFVDHRATVILDKHMEAETKMKESIGSTGEGVGAATAEKVMRRAPKFVDWWEDTGRFEKNSDMICVINSSEYLTTLQDTWTILEGTQGYHLSLNVGQYYPFCTSRDCGPDAIMAQVGISGRSYEENEIVCVLRTFPIRVGGNSGPLPGETDWDTLKEFSNGYISIPERTTVTKKIRRIAWWDNDIVGQTVMETAPTALAITFLDYLFPDLAKVQGMRGLSKESLEWLDAVQVTHGVPVKYVSTGPGQKYTFEVTV